MVLAMNDNSYQEDRKRRRTLKQASQKERVTFLEGLKLWANQWRWSNIKKMYREEYIRVKGNADYIITTKRLK